MDESSSRFRIPKTLDEEMACVINASPNSTVYVPVKWKLKPPPPPVHTPGI